MNTVMDYAKIAAETVLSFAIFGFIVLSVVLFITDGIKAKREHRNRKVGVKIMFIISIIILNIFIVAVLLMLAAIIAYALSA